MPFYTIRGSAPGNMGDNTQLDTSVHPPRVLRLDYAIDAWLGGELIECFPIHLVSDQLADALFRSGLGSFEIRQVEIVIEPEAEELREMSGLDSIPDFRWLHVTGVPGQDDIGLNSAWLVVSDHALDIFRQFNLQGCDIEEYSG